MHLLVGGRRAVELPALFGHDRVQLRMDVAPLTHAPRADEVLAQQLLVLAIAELVVTVAALGLLQPLPQLQVADELGLLVVELAVALIGGLLLLQRPVAHILAAQGRRDDQHLGKRLPLARLEDHAADARVERQLGERAADVGELVALVHRIELGEQRITVGDRLLRRRLEERKILHRAEVQALHAQDHAGQRRTQDLRVGEARAAGVVGLVVQADADAVGHAAAAAGALIRRRLTHRLDLQLLDLVAVAVALDARQARIDDVADAGHRQ